MKRPPINETNTERFPEEHGKSLTGAEQFPPDKRKGLTGAKPVPPDKENGLTEAGTPLSKDAAGTVRQLFWDVETRDAGKTVEQFLREHGCSHHILTQLKRRENGICRNGVWTYANQRLVPGDHIDISITEAANSAHILPVALPLSIVYEDEDLIVVNKPCGMPAHPSMGNYENTLANAVMYHCQSRPFVFRCINRLDRDTSGLLIIAKNSYSGAVLAESLSRRQIHREYLAIAEGILPVSQTIDAPIARKPGSALMRCVDRVHGERAVTHVRRLACYEYGSTGRLAATPGQQKNVPRYISLAAVRLETGRTHQIRVHLSYTGHPLPGDFLYNPPAAPGPDRLQPLISRQALHAHRLSFPHPVTGKPLAFEAPMPDDMRRLMSAYNRLSF